MALFYNRAQRRNPQDPEGPQKWYPVLRSTGMIKQSELAKLLADETTLNPKEAEMAIYQLFKVIVRVLFTGATVPLGDMGSFRLTISTTGADTEAEATADKVKQVNLRFMPSKDLKHELSKAEFIYLKSMLLETPSADKP